MNKTNGILTQKFDIVFNTDKLITQLAEIVKEHVENALNNVVSNYEIDACYGDDGYIVIEGSYQTNYSVTNYPATKTDPPEYDLERDIENLDKNAIMNHILNNIIDKTISSSDIMKNIEPDITEYDDSIIYEEYEPDWDSMPGGHDDY